MMFDRQYFLKKLIDLYYFRKQNFVLDTLGEMESEYAEKKNMYLRGQIEALRKIMKELEFDRDDIYNIMYEARTTAAQYYKEDYPEKIAEYEKEHAEYIAALS